MIGYIIVFALGAWVGIGSLACFSIEKDRAARDRIAELEAAKDNAYSERNRLAIAFCKVADLAGLKAGIHVDKDHPEWDDEWKNVVMVTLPNGEQVSWHLSPDEVALAKDLPGYNGTWDGTYLARESDWPNKIFLPSQERNKP